MDSGLRSPRRVRASAVRSRAARVVCARQFCSICGKGDIRQRRPAAWVAQVRPGGHGRRQRQMSEFENKVVIVTGAGGAPHDSEYLHRRPHLWEPFTYKLIGDRFSFTVCDIDGDQLTLRQVDADGLEIDRIVITR